MESEVNPTNRPEVFFKSLIENNSTTKEEPQEFLISDVRSVPEAQYAFTSVEHAPSMAKTEQNIKEEYVTSPISEQISFPDVDKENREDADEKHHSLSRDIKFYVKKTIKKESSIDNELQEVKHIKEEEVKDFPVKQYSLGKNKTPRCGLKRDKHRTRKVKPCRRTPPADPNFFFKCEVCDKVIKHQSNVADHQRIHTGERPYECEVCSKNFTRNTDLLKHRMVHSKLRPHKCKTCGKRFKLSSALSKHSKVHSDQYPFKCESCEKTFKRSSCLVKHMRSHTEEKPFACETCKKCFKWESSLREHRRIHSGEKPFVCPYCMKSYTHLSTFLQHKRLHDEHPSFPCDICDRSFDRKSNLLNHKRRAHK
ncbi:zinc finger protein 436-like isoform X2 [Pseudophryne corroboree]|uniref:zinc finger protein 436-like isoform X2 n=1 Tax=Pseudophryne corroboree TaxID=495146 RepID=UPI00308183E9